MKTVRFIILVAACVFLQPRLPATQPPGSLPLLKPIVLSEQFFSEGAAFADINGDGVQDVVSGPFWYAGPDFRRRVSYTDGHPLPIAGYSPHFFSFVGDFNGDHRPDVLAIAMPGQAAYWFQNPGPVSGHWKKHLALPEVGNESPLYVDITGDGQPELVCLSGGAYGYARPDAADPTRPWNFVPVTEQRGYGAFTHGMGVGDVNGDGRPDLLEKNGWWEQPEQVSQLFRFHSYPFAQAGGSQMYAYDFDGDGDNDVVSVQNAHAFGLKWFEQRGVDGDIGFVSHDILPDQYDEQAELNISQMHSLALADMDGDGIADLITGKRFYAHGGKDPGAQQLPVLYWFRTVRDGAGVHFEPHLIDARTGVGTQLTVGDLSGNGQPDIVVGNKLGTTVVLNQGRTTQTPQFTRLMQQIGSDQYAQTIRTSEPLSPAQEQATFVLPAGFEAQLVVAEPQIAKPMNMAFDERGRLWVTSSEEYPYAAPDDRPGRDRIVVLEDRDGDGHREHVTTFADGLNIPIGLYPFQDGVICFSIPDIVFLRDTDGDGRCDHREKLYGPMGYERDTHGMCNAFTRGFDGWLYACHGFNNHTTVAGSDQHQITMQSGNTFRMRLDGSRIEHFTHGLVNPFGMAQTPTGDMLVADCHTKPVSLLLPGGYYDSFGKPHDGLGYVPNVMEHLHGSTAIGGIAQYNADAFPDVYHGSTFGGNVMTCRINRNSLQPVGSGFRAREEPDFLIAADPWFRPVDLQVGPDDALYVADFYNRIIGHYEVKLDHPGRDRHRGRIWKIVYTGSETRRDAGAVIDLATEQGAELGTAESAQELFDRLDSSSQTQRMTAMDALTDRFPQEAAVLAATGLTHDNPTVRSHSRWILHRLNQLTDAGLRSGIDDSVDSVRIHAYRVLMDTAPTPAGCTELLQQGFRDEAALVRRAAVHAAARHTDSTLIRPLIRLYHATPADDVHLRHSVRMALRDHLLNPASFQQMEAVLQPADVPLVAGICLALDSPAAGEFLVRHIQQLSTAAPERFADYVRFAVRHVSPETVGVLTEVARQRFRDDPDFQLELLDAAREGLSQRGAEITPVVRSWALDLASKFLSLTNGALPEPGPAPIAWTYHPYPGTPDRGNPFVATSRRKSTDGMKNTPLISSIPRGESWTGIYRSDVFQPTGRFSFFMAGHDGFPDKPAAGRNLVRLRDASTHQILQTWHPPRNDTAHPFEWTENLSDIGEVYLEVVDGDTAAAFAWLAVGRFSVDGLNPQDEIRDQHNGIRLADDFQLTELRDVLAELLRRSGTDLESASLLAATLARWQSDSRLMALSASIGTVGMTGPMRTAAYRALVDAVPEQTPELIGSIMKVASGAEQLKIASALCVDTVGASLLVSLAEQGLAAPSLLQRPSITDRIRALKDDQLTDRVQILTANLPDIDEAIETLISERRRQYLQHTGDAGAGAEIFTKNCAVCHQVAGKGKKVGPNLDGIGNRGLDRLVEDILAPNRNVDIAFRSTTVVQTSGRVVSGLSKGLDGARLILINSKGEQISIPQQDIEEQVTSRRSPMPENVAEVLTEEQFRNLLAWLLSLRS
ncbi:MAG: FG-GAP-like repeat-containing protein [Fuerstiella sp.]